MKYSWVDKDKLKDAARGVTDDLFLPPPPPAPSSAKSTSTTSYKYGKSGKLSVVVFLHYLTVPRNTKRSKICDDVPYNGNWHTL